MKRMWFMVTMTMAWTAVAAGAPPEQLEFPAQAEVARGVAEALKTHWQFPFEIVTGGEIVPSEGRLVIAPAAAPAGEARTMQGVLADWAVPACWEEAVKSLGGASALDLRLRAPAWNGLPIPLDAMIVAVRSQLRQSGDRTAVTVTLPDGEWWSRSVDLWNVYVLLKCFSESDFDLKAARTAYLEENFGPAAAAMRDYFRIGERTYLAAAALSGIERPGKLDPVEVFSRPVLEQLQRALAQAYEATPPDTQYRVNVEQEQKGFAAVRQALDAQREARVRRLRAIPGQAAAAQPLVAPDGEPARVASSVSMWADAENLYLIFTADEPDMAARKIAHAGRDESGMWDDDGFELFLSPDPDHPGDGYQFIVNARGAVWDGRRTPTQCDVAWSAEHARAEAETTAAGWQLTLTLPWRDFGFDGVPARPWRANFYRNRMAGGGREAYAWSPVMSASYYQPARFGWLYWNEK